MKKYTYLVNFDSQALERVGESFAVKGDGGIAELEFIIPSDFGIPAAQAVWRAYYKRPGERESLFETLPTVEQTESGDYVTGWVITKALTQTSGRLGFSLAAISGNNIQWNSRTVIVQVQESQYQPESEEAEEPYTGRLAILEGDMAAIRGEFAEVQEDFEDLKETATLGTPIPENLTANMQAGHVYIYTGTEPGYTAGHVYYYVDGTLTDGGVYGGTAVDATLTESGKAADAAAVGAEVSAIKEDLSALNEDLVTTENIDFSINKLLVKYISPSSNTWAGNVNVAGNMIPTNGANKLNIVANDNSPTVSALLKSNKTVLHATPDYANGWDSRLVVNAGESATITIPEDCTYIWFMTSNATSDYMPTLATLERRVNIKSMANDVDVLKTYHPDRSGKIVSILGDSISTFVPTADKVDGKAPEGCTTTYPGNVTKYATSDVTSENLTWWGRVIAHFGMVLGINESWAGSTIGYNPNYTNSGKYTADNCMCSTTRIGHLGENGTPDVIIVFGGTNDINHHMSGSNIRFAVGELDSAHNPYDFENFPMITDTYYGAITTMLLRIQHTYPNTTILMLLPYFCTSTHTSATDVATPYDQNTWSNVAIDVCKYLGVEYLDLRKIINLYDVSSLLFDGLHPNANGMNVIAKAVIHKLDSML